MPGTFFDHCIIILHALQRKVDFSLLHEATNSLAGNRAVFEWVYRIKPPKCSPKNFSTVFKNIDAEKVLDFCSLEAFYDIHKVPKSCLWTLGELY